MNEYDVLVLDTPPHPSVVPFLRLARREGIPSILDLRDVWGFEHESYPFWRSLSPRKRRARWSLSLRDEAVRAADHVVTTTPEMSQAMRQRCPDLDPSHFSCIPNAYQTVDPSTEASSARRPSTLLRVVYTGSLAYGRAGQARRFIEAMEYSRGMGGQDVELLLAGDGGKQLIESLASGVSTEQVHDLGPLDREGAISLQRSADALLLLQPSDYLGTRVAIPAKLFEYMARRIPIFGMVGSGSAGRLIREYGLGVVPSGEDPGSLARALEQLSEQIRISPRLAEPPEEYSERSTMAAFAQVLNRVTA